MRQKPVLWSEGMFLLPHHFQAMDGCWNELLQTSDRMDHAYNYGLAHCEFSAEAIANFHFQLNAYHARMKDGTIVSLAPTSEPQRTPLRAEIQDLSQALGQLTVNLEEGLRNEAAVRIYLGVPKGAGIAAEGAPTEAFRYSESKLLRPDDAMAGNEQEISLKELNVRLLLSTQDVSGYELLPIAQVKRVGDTTGGPELDRSYIPPLLNVESWPPLSREIVRSLFDQIGKKIETLTAQVVDGEMTISSSEPGEAERVWMLAQLNEAYALLRVMAFARGVHPLHSYLELCRIVGQLSIFGKTRRTVEPPPYDHDDLARIFLWAKETIEELLRSIRDPEYQQRPFIGTGLGMHVPLDAEWLSGDWKWYVGVLHEAITNEECRDLLGPDKLNWKLGAKNRVEEMFRQGIPGLHLEQISRAPAGLPRSKNWNYYVVSRNCSAWSEIQSTQTLAMRLQDRLIENLGELQGQRRIQVRWDNRRVPLEFALFAVRMPS